MDEVNAPAVVQSIDDVMRGFGVDTEKFLLLTSGAAAYTKACGNILRTMYLYLHDSTCLCHLLHNDAMQIQAENEGVNEKFRVLKLLLRRTGQEQKCLLR